MFTGLIEGTGRIDRVEPLVRGSRARIATPLGAELRPGDSIAVAGVCLTVVNADAGGFSADLSAETLRATTLAAARAGRLVNLERPVRADGRLGGHFVLGHVDGVGRIITLRPDGECFWLDIEVPAAIEPLAVPKGSIAVDGVSLTVASLAPRRIGLQIIPFTWSHTALHEAQLGDGVNIEADVIGKYVARLLGPSAQPAAAAIAGRSEERS